MVQKIKKVKYLGKNIKYKNVVDLSKQIGGTRDDARKLILGTLTTYVKNEDKYEALNLNDKPLLLKKLNIKKITKNVKKQLISDEGIIKGVEVKKLNKIDDNDKFKSGLMGSYNVRLTMTYEVSIEIIIRHADKTFIGTPQEVIDQSMFYYRYVYPVNIPGHKDINLKIEFLGLLEPITKIFTETQMYNQTPLSLSHYYVNIDMNEGFDCVRRHLKNKYKKISPDTIDNFFKNRGVTINELETFCKKYSILMEAYNISGQLMSSYVPEKINKSYGALTFINYDSHLYPLKNGLLQKKTHDELKIEIIDDSLKLLNDFIINKKILPAEIKYNGYEIISFIVNDTKYIMNDEYNKCLEYLKKFDLESKIYDNIKILNLFNIIEQKYATENASSFWPCCSLYTMSATLYKTDIEYDINKVSSIDSNKHYTACLKELPYLIKTDYRMNKIIKHKITPELLNDRHLYLIVPEYESILLDCCGPFPGYYLKYCTKEGLKFTVYEEMTCETVDNYYKNMIDDLNEKIDDKNHFKNIFNVGIGKMSPTENSIEKTIVNGIYDNEEVKTLAGYKTRLNDNYSIVYNKEKSIINLYNKQPINIQIKLQSKIMVYEKMQSLKLKQNDIIQIKTDCISYIGDLPDNLSNKLGEWKKEEFKPIKDVSEREFEKKTFDIEPISYFNNVYYDGYAGCGKTFKVLNEIVPSLTKSFMILTPSHQSLKEYRANNLKCDVIQKYTIRNKIPNEEIIIIDEVGMIDKSGHDLIYKCSLLEKQIICLGDYRQLLPVSYTTSINSDHYLNFMFKTISFMEGNKRNNFTKEYYDKLINEKVNLINEVKKYSTKNIKDAEVIICYRNDIVDEYNELMMKELNLNKYSIGLKIICRSNKLFEYDIYNNFTCTIKDINKTHITLSNDVKIPIKSYDKYFKPAYAMTLYGVQGQTIKSYYYPEEDYKFINGRSAYTLISRLKQ